MKNKMQTTQNAMPIGRHFGEPVSQNRATGFRKFLKPESARKCGITRMLDTFLQENMKPDWRIY